MCVNLPISEKKEFLLNLPYFIRSFRNYIDSDNIGVLSRIAKNPNTPVELLSQLFNYANKKTPQKNKYTYGKYYLILDNLACNQNATTDLLTQLSKIDVDMVLFCVAYNPNTPLGILQKLVKLQDSAVSTAANANLQRHFK